MSIPGAAQEEGDLEAEADRDTVELDGSTLKRLREMNPESGSASRERRPNEPTPSTLPGQVTVSVADDDLDRDTVELSAAEVQSLAKKAGGPPSSPSASSPGASSPSASSPSASGEVPIPLKARRNLAELDAEAFDRPSMQTLPSPPLLEDED